MFLFLVLLCFLFVKLFTVFILLLSLMNIYMLITLNCIEYIAYLHFLSSSGDLLTLFEYILCFLLLPRSCVAGCVWAWEILGPVSVHWLVSGPQVLICWREESRVALCSAVVFMVE